MIVDIHNHILPGLDDGPKNMEETLLLARQAVESGISDVIATPHHMHRFHNELFKNNPHNIIEVVNEVNEILTKEAIHLQIYPGMEIHLYEGILDDIDKKFDSFLTINNTGRYILLEPPSKVFPDFTEKVLLKLLDKGLQPILAHPERNRALRKSPEKIYDLVKKGLLVQLTAGSIVGIHGKRLMNFSKHLLNHHLVHLVASDAHHFSQRKFELLRAYQIIEKDYSSRLKEYLNENANHVLKGTNIKSSDPITIKGKKQYVFFYSHPLNQR